MEPGKYEENPTVISDDGVQTYSPMQQTHGSMQPAHNSIQQTHGSIQQTHGSMQQAHGSMQPTHSSMQPTHSSMQPTHSSMQPTHSSMQQTHTSMQPTHSSMQPTHSSMQPTHSSMQPTHTSMQPTHSSMQPTHNSMQPTHSSMQPTHSSMQPMHSSMQPTHSSMQPTHSSMQPTHSSMQLTHSSMQPTHSSMQPTHGSMQQPSMMPQQHQNFNYQPPLPSFIPTYHDTMSIHRPNVSTKENRTTDVMAGPSNSTHSHHIILPPQPPPPLANPNTAPSVSVNLSMPPPPLTVLQKPAPPKTPPRLDDQRYYSPSYERMCEVGRAIEDLKKIYRERVITKETLLNLCRHELAAEPPQAQNNQQIQQVQTFSIPQNQNPMYLNQVASQQQMSCNNVMQQSTMANVARGNQPLSVVNPIQRQMSGPFAQGQHYTTNDIQLSIPAPMMNPNQPVLRGTPVQHQMTNNPPMNQQSSNQPQLYYSNPPAQMVPAVSNSMPTSNEHMAAMGANTTFISNQQMYN